MATQPLTAEDLIAAAKRLRRRGMKKSDVKNIKDIENAADKTEEHMRDLIYGLQEDLNDVFKLAVKIGNRDVMNAIEILNGYGEDF